MQAVEPGRGYDVELARAAASSHLLSRLKSATIPGLRSALVEYREDGELAHEHLLGPGEQVIAPVDRGLECLLPTHGRAAAPDQQTKAVIQPGGDLGVCQHRQRWDRVGAEEKRPVMSMEENKALARRFFEDGWNKHNLALVDELFSTDYVEHRPVPGMPPTRGDSSRWPACSGAASQTDASTSTIRSPKATRW
jgi:hypothetical protein